MQLSATVRSMVDEAEAWRPTRGGGATRETQLRGGSWALARRAGGGDFASHAYVRRVSRMARRQFVRVLSAVHMVVYVACACSRLACTLTGMALMLEKRYERGGLPTCSARRLMTKATGCVVRRRGGERASVVEIEGQTREGGE